MDRHQVSTAVMGQIPVSAAATRTSAGRSTASPSAAVRATCKFWEGTSDIKVEKILNEWKWKFHGGEKIFGTNSIQARGFYIYFDGFPLYIYPFISIFYTQVQLWQLPLRLGASCLPLHAGPAPVMSRNTQIQGRGRYQLFSV